MLTMRVDSRYKGMTKIGEGGMAVVYRAHDTKLGRDVAIKVIAPQFAGDIQFRGRFMREVQLLAKLQHPNIVPVYDYDVSEAGAYYVMALIEGVSLRDKIADNSIDLDSFVVIADGLLAGLGYAHRMGIVHRDIKPENILIDADGNPFLTDFGIARLIDSDVTKMTRTGTFLGTATYATPEQYDGKTVGPAADIYSLGIIFYEMLAGKPPFTGNLSRIMKGHLLEPAPPFNLENRILQKHPEVGETILAMLQKTPKKRPQSCETVYLMMNNEKNGKQTAAESVKRTVAPAPPGIPEKKIKLVINPYLKKVMEEKKKKAFEMTIGAGFCTLLIVFGPLLIFNVSLDVFNNTKLVIIVALGIGLIITSTLVNQNIDVGYQASIIITIILIILYVEPCYNLFVKNSGKLKQLVSHSKEAAVVVLGYLGYFLFLFFALKDQIVGLYHHKKCVIHE